MAFKIQPHDHADKSFDIEGPGIRLTVDYDDVNHDEVDELAQIVVRCLNDNWNCKR
jgi:hypothetical protein